MTLRLTNRALRRLQEVHGIDLYRDGLSKLDLAAEGTAPFVKIYWAGRLAAEPNLTMEQATADADELTPGELMALVTGAVTAAYGIKPSTEPEAAPTGEATDKSWL